MPNVYVTFRSCGRIGLNLNPESARRAPEFPSEVLDLGPNREHLQPELEFLNYCLTCKSDWALRVVIWGPAVVTGQDEPGANAGWHRGGKVGWAVSVRTSRKSLGCRRDETFTHL